MRKTISHLADRLGDAMATLFTLLALLLIPHAVIRAIIGQALHQWTPITWLAIHTALTIAALVISLASYALAGLLSDGWSVMRTDVLPGLGGKGECEVGPHTCYEPSFPPTIVYILEKEAE